MHPTPTPNSPCTGNTPDWKDAAGDGCEWYEINDYPGCPINGKYYEGTMGVANDNCCYCIGETPMPTLSPTEDGPATAEPTSSPIEDDIATPEPTSSSTKDDLAAQVPTSSPTEDDIALALATLEPTSSPTESVAPTSSPTKDDPSTRGMF